MLKEQLDAVSDQLMSDDNAEIRQKIFNAYQEEPERGADMIISFATDKGLKLDATADEVVNHLENLDEEVDIEMTPEELADVAGGYDSLYQAMREDRMSHQARAAWVRRERRQTSTGDMPPPRNWPPF